MNTTFDNATTKTLSAAGATFVYREYGSGDGPPVIFLNHLTGVLDDWDPALIDGFAARHRVVIFDNRGVGASSGVTPGSIEEMAKDATVFIDALGLSSVDLFGFSMGGFVAQLIAHDRPELVRRLILAGTGPAGGKGINAISKGLEDAIAQAADEERHPKQILFFSQTPSGQRAADDFLLRLNSRHDERDLGVGNQTIAAHLLAITAWGNSAGLGRPMDAIRQPVLVANGDNDVMVPTANTIALFEALPNARLSVFPDAGHGGIFQYHREFVGQASRFLGEPV